MKKNYTSAMKFIADDLCKVRSAYRRLYFAVIYWKSPFGIETRSMGSLSYHEMSIWVDEMEKKMRVSGVPFVIYVNDRRYTDHLVLELYED